MKIKRTEPDSADLELSLKELDLLRNGLNEARLAVKGDADFETRLGSSKAEADQLIAALQLLISEIARSERSTRRAAG
jgi:hypothetical protein